MLAYAPRPDPKQLRPATLGLIVLGHIGLLALVMTAKSPCLHMPSRVAATSTRLMSESEPTMEPTNRGNKPRLTRD